MNELCNLKVHINGHHTLHLHQARIARYLQVHSSHHRLRSSCEPFATAADTSGLLDRLISKITAGAGAGPETPPAWRSGSSSSCSSSPESRHAGLRPLVVHGQDAGVDAPLRRDGSLAAEGGSRAARRQAEARARGVSARRPGVRSSSCGITRGCARCKRCAPGALNFFPMKPAEITRQTYAFGI
ncbi:unnamed protein product [Urochloa humidicola]